MWVDRLSYTATSYLKKRLIQQGLLQKWVESTEIAEMSVAKIQRPNMGYLFLTISHRTLFVIVNKGVL